MTLGWEKFLGKSFLILFVSCIAITGGAQAFAAEGDVSKECGEHLDPAEVIFHAGEHKTIKHDDTVEILKLNYSVAIRLNPITWNEIGGFTESKEKQSTRRVSQQSIFYEELQNKKSETTIALYEYANSLSIKEGLKPAYDIEKIKANPTSIPPWSYEGDPATVEGYRLLTGVEVPLLYRKIFQKKTWTPDFFIARTIQVDSRPVKTAAPKSKSITLREQYELQRKAEEETRLKNPLFKINPATFAFEGLTPHGLQVLKQQRDIYRARERLFNAEFRNLGTVFHAMHVARLGKHHMALLGGPGGAKSGVVNWMLSGESVPVFKLQFNEQTPVQALIGGQDFKKAKSGIYIHNTEGSLVDYPVAALDEGEKGLPATLAALLSILQERKVYPGGKEIDALLETAYMTGNATLPEIVEQFRLNNQNSTAYAFLSRFMIKAVINNRLDPEAQAYLDERQQRRERLLALAPYHPEVRQDEVFIKPQPLDWVALRALRGALFVANQQLMTTFNQFANDLWDQTNEAVKFSEANHKSNRNKFPHVVQPAADFNERFRKLIPGIILDSAFLDFLKSPLADDDQIEFMTKRPFEVDALSLWRAFLVTTTVTSGSSRVVYDQNAIDNKYAIDYGVKIDPEKARDARDELMYKDMIDEQKRTHDIFRDYIKKIQKELEVLSRNAYNPAEAKSLEENSIERLIQPELQENIDEALKSKNSEQKKD